VQILQILVGQILVELDRHIIMELVAAEVVPVLLVEGRDQMETLMVVTVLPSLFRDLQLLMLEVVVVEEHQVPVDLADQEVVVAVMLHQDLNHHLTQPQTVVPVVVVENHPVVMVEMAAPVS
tara:strand:- start:68 stop:433 length:366 start_codon:yes stop_codon:yes gene_type:complete